MHSQLQQQWDARGAMPKRIGAAALAAVSLLVIALPGAAAERATFAFGTLPRDVIQGFRVCFP